MHVLFLLEKIMKSCKLKVKIPFCFVCNREIIALMPFFPSFFLVGDVDSKRSDRAGSLDLQVLCPMVNKK